MNMNPESDSCANGFHANDVPSKEMEAKDDSNHYNEEENSKQIIVLNGSDNSRKANKKISSIYDQERYYLGRYTRPFDGCYSSRSLNITTVYCKDCKHVMDLTILPGHLITHLNEPIELGKTCKKCCRNFENLDDLIQHQNSVFAVRDENFCLKCNKKSLNWELHKNHMIKRHSVDNFHICPLCDFQATLLARIITHITLTHRVVPCPYCLMLTDIHLFAINDTYRDEDWKQNNLERELSLFWMHLQKHFSVQDAFSCPKCMLSFLNPADLAEHIESHNFVSKKLSSELLGYEFQNEESKGDLYNKEEFKRFFQKSKIRSSQNSYIMKENNTRTVPSKCVKTTRKNPGHHLKNLPSNQPSVNQMPFNVFYLVKALYHKSKPIIESTRKPNSSDFTDVSNDAILMHFILQSKATTKSYFLPNSYLLDEPDKFLSFFKAIGSKKVITTDFIKVLSARLLQNYAWKCLTCEQNIIDLTHYAAKPIFCTDEHCYYKTYCTNDMLLHQKCIDRNNLNEPSFFIIGHRFINEPDRRLVSAEQLSKAREFEEEYDVENEIEDIRNEFPNDICPFYIHVCIQCALSFSSPMSAAYHVFHKDNTTRNDLGVVYGLEQSHVVFRRCLVRTFRYIDEDIQLELNYALKAQAEKILTKLNSVFRTEIRKYCKKNQTFSDIYNGRYLSPACQELYLDESTIVPADYNTCLQTWWKPLSAAAYGNGVDRFEGHHINRDRSSDPDQNGPKLKKSRK